MIRVLHLAITFAMRIEQISLVKTLNKENCRTGRVVLGTRKINYCTIMCDKDYFVFSGQDTRAIFADPGLGAYRVNKKLLQKHN